MKAKRLIPLLTAVLFLAGCASAARDTTGFALVDEATVNAPFEDAWQIAKTVLREGEYDIYTRDSRGLFVAFSSPHRGWTLVPKRTKLTITLEEISVSATRVTVETVDQVYGVTLLTYPDWHDRKANGNEEAADILVGIQAKVSGEAPVETAAEGV